MFDISTLKAAHFVGPSIAEAVDWITARNKPVSEGLADYRELLNN
jgi:glycine cleavage system aminomethyltransferase T